MKPKKRIKAAVKKNEKKKFNFKPLIITLLVIAAVAALYALFVSLGIELGKLVNASVLSIYNGEIL
ncbi:MAG: hypothetical protein II135_03760 [Clostridia bacterium]|nr:hypothetical protein [Clostridia bacterium]MBQ3870661.1 hypothetical protein [Clostridia bacterium]